MIIGFVDFAVYFAEYDDLAATVASFLSVAVKLGVELLSS